MDRLKNTILLGFRATRQSNIMDNTWLYKIIMHRFFLPVAFLINFLIHFPFMNTPPQSVHLWRQCNTLAVARNFYLEDMNIAHTRVDNRFETDGITGSHFPAYEYGVALLYKLFGEQFWVHRYFSLIIFYAGGIGLFYLLSLLFANRHIPVIGTFSYLFAPGLFYHQINALPDILALSSSIWGFYFFVYWYTHLFEKKHQSVLYWAAATFCTTLTGMTKLQYLAIGFPIVVYFILTFRTYGNLKVLIGSGLYGLISVGFSLYWYKRAVFIIKQSGLADYGLEFRPETDLLKALEILAGNIFSDLPEMILNFASFGLMLIGIYFIFKQKDFKQKWFLPFLIYAGALILYHLIELRQMEHHGYYTMPYYIVLLALVGYGGAMLIKKQQYVLLMVFLLAQPVLATIRILPTRWLSPKKGVPEVLYQKETREEIEQIIPPEALTIVGPDISHCILFYFTHTRGFAFDDPAALTGPDASGEKQIENYIRRGASYLVLKEEGEESATHLLPYVETVLFRKGDVLVAKLKKPE